MAAPDPAPAMERLRATARDLLSLTTGVGRDDLRRSPAAAEWSAATVVEHLADAELVYGVRIRMVLTGDRPYLVPYDERAWVARFGELEDDPKQTLARWRMLRDVNVRLLESLDDAEWRLTGRHGERGEISVADIAELMATHDRTHLDQIRKALAAVG